MRPGRLCPFLVAPAAALFAALSPALAENSGLGPWEIEAVYKNGAFDRCALGRVLDNDISVTFVRTGNVLSLLLSSPYWQLEAGKDYPVTIKLGPQSWKREVEAKVNAVSMRIDGAKFLAGLKGANALDIVAAGATIRVPLDGSRSAFDRLGRCVTGAGNVIAAGNDADPETKAETEAAEGAERPVVEPPPPPVKPQTAQEGPDESPSSAAGPPPPTAKPAAQAKAGDANAGDAGARDAGAEEATAETTTSEEDAGEDGSAEEAIAASEEETPETPAAKPEKPPAQAAKKASPTKKRSSSSGQSARRAFQREVDRIRRFFGN